MTIWPNHTWPTLQISLTFPRHHHSERFQWLHSTFPNSAGQILLAGKPGIEKQGPFGLPFKYRLSLELGE